MSKKVSFFSFSNKKKSKLHSEVYTESECIQHKVPGGVGSNNINVDDWDIKITYAEGKKHKIYVSGRSD